MRPSNLIVLAIVTVLVVFLETAFSGLRNVLRAQIDLLPALMVYAALICGLEGILIVSALGGLCFDSLSANPLGASFFPLFVVGLILYWNREVVLRDQPFAQVVLGLIACGLSPVFLLLILLTMGWSPLIGWGTLWQWLVMTFGGAAFVPLLFKLFTWIEHTLQYAPLPESVFRKDREIVRAKGRF